MTTKITKIVNLIGTFLRSDISIKRNFDQKTIYAFIKTMLLVTVDFVNKNNF